MRKLLSTWLLVLITGLFSGCLEKEVAELPPPALLTDDAIGYYCNMTVTEHQGPKGQIRLKNLDNPVWFSSVRDTIAFTLLPEEPKSIDAIYVTDMSKESAWENPEGNDWIEISSAYFVMGSTKNGGMGAPEPVPFSTRETAEKFAEKFGGNVVTYADIPESSILGPVEIGSTQTNEDPDR